MILIERIGTDVKALLILILLMIDNPRMVLKSWLSTQALDG